MGISFLEWIWFPPWWETRSLVKSWFPGVNMSPLVWICLPLENLVSPFECGSLMGAILWRIGGQEKFLEKRKEGRLLDYSFIRYFVKPDCSLLRDIEKNCLNYKSLYYKHIPVYSVNSRPAPRQGKEEYSLGAQERGKYSLNGFA